MKHIADALSGLEVGDPVTHQNMAYFPLLGGDGGEAGYLTLDEALAQGNARVTETSEQGSVPELCFLNEAGKPVLLMDGEELVGAKQNRILNLSILAPKGEAITIPVSCVESGRWRHNLGIQGSAPGSAFQRTGKKIRPSVHVTSWLRASQVESERCMGR